MIDPNLPMGSLSDGRSLPHTPYIAICFCCDEPIYEEEDLYQVEDDLKKIRKVCPECKDLYPSPNERE